MPFGKPSIYFILKNAITKVKGRALKNDFHAFNRAFVSDRNRLIVIKNASLFSKGITLMIISLISIQAQPAMPTF